MHVLTYGLFVLALAALLPTSSFANDGSPSSTNRAEGMSRIVPLATGDDHSCALRSNGSAVCWGRNDEGQTNVPEGAGPFISLAAGGLHSCGLGVDGRATCWGAGQPGESGGYNLGQSSPPANAQPFVALAAGNLHTCGLQADGDMACWGRNDEGQAPASLVGPFRAIAGGYNTTCGLKVDGSIACLGTGQQNHDGPFASVSLSSSKVCATNERHEIACWSSIGGVSSGASPEGPFIAVLPTDFSDVCGMRADGRVTCWTPGGYTQIESQEFASASSAAIGRTHICALQPGGAIACQGSNNDYGKLNAPQGGPFRFGQIATDHSHSCQTRPDNSLACWGSNADGKAMPPTGAFGQVVAGDVNACAIGMDGRIACWGGSAGYLNSMLNGQLWPGPKLQIAPTPNGGICMESRYGYPASDGSYNYTSCVPVNGGYTIGWPFAHADITHARDIVSQGHSYNKYCGVTFEGQGICVSGSEYDAAHAGVFGGSWLRFASGLAHQCGLKSNGTLECWGSNVDGQTDNVPTGRFRALSTGYNHACAIREDGQIACWGSNVNGQASPPPGAFVQVAAGNTATCAIRGDGVRVCWGNDAQGQAPQLSLGGTVASNVLIDIAYPGTAFSLVDAGTNADGDYVPPAPAFYIDPADLPPGLSLSVAGQLTGTPTAAGNYTFTVEGEDANGFAASRDYVMTVIDDSSPPAIGYTLNGAAEPGMPDGSNGWYVSDVALDWTVTDTESAASIDSGCVDSTVNTDTSSAGAIHACSASSAGGSASKSVAIKRDATDPTITVAPATTANGNGWHNSDVSVLVNCSDASPGSGVDACPTLPNVTDEGTTTVPAQQVSDVAGNTGSSAAFDVKLDKTAPGIVASPSPAAPNGNNGWYTGNVTVGFACNDATSGLAAACPGNQTLVGDGTGISSTAQPISDLAGNSTTSNVVTVKIDATAPTISAAPAPASPDGNNSWYISPVTVAFSCDDATSGIATCPANQTLSSDGNPVSSSAQTATDNAGNVSLASNTISVKIDRTAPALAPSLPNPILRGQSYVASPNATDAMSGVATSSCGAVDTSALGGKSLSCNASDNAGNSASASLDYTVTTTCSNDGYKGTQLTWCRNICENGLSEAQQQTWIHRWIGRYRDDPLYCLVETD